MSGSRLGRGRMGRLAIIGCVTITVIIVMFIYKTTSAEMARLKSLHAKCAQQQEVLAAQLQVIYEYKVQLEKTLSNEESANAAAKEELQKKASRERSLRDKDSLEATQRFNALQQNYKLLQTEHQDLKDDCKKKEEVALENSKKLEATLLELRQQQKKISQESEKSKQNLENKYLEVMQEKDQIEEKYNELKKSTGENSGYTDHLQKKIIQLQRELEEAHQKALHHQNGILKTENSLLTRPANQANLNNDIDNIYVHNGNKPAASDNNSMQVIRPSSQHQVSVSASNSVKLAAAAPPAQSPAESSSSSSVSNNKPATKVKLPLGVPPIPRLFESANKEEPKLVDESGNKPPDVGQLVGPELAAGPADHHPKLPPNDAIDDKQPARRNELKMPGIPGRHAGVEQKNSDRHQADVWYKLKAGVQEVGDPHHLEKNGFENAGANEDIEHYDDYNYKEPQNKNGDLHLEEGEDEREDEDDYMHKNMNIVKHE